MVWRSNLNAAAKNKIWIDPSIHSGDRKFYVPDDYPLEEATCGIDAKGRKFINVKGVRWFTNLDNGYRHEPLRLMTMDRCLRYHPKMKNLDEYQKYDNYDALQLIQFSKIITALWAYQLLFLIDIALNSCFLKSHLSLF